MSSKEKRLERIRQKPRNVREGELISLMDAWGFMIKKTKEGYVFRHPRLRNRRMPTMAHPHGREESVVLYCYVKDCLDAIDELEEEQ